ncbi:MAG: hypothetical protein ACW98I_02950 [Candidatus Hodarchaeales archaeon]|jgi:hypothetical protein
MSNQRKLILTLNNPDAVQKSHWDRLNMNEFTLTAVTGTINELKVVSEAVLVIKFETGELRLDIGMNDLKNMKNVE